MNRDYLKWAALLFALVATASAEYELARAVGFNATVAAAVPGALDVWTVRAMRQHRDVLLAVFAMIAVNAASHLVTAGLIPVSVPLVVAVSAIAPLVLYRVHHITRGEQPVPAAGEPAAVEAPADAPAATVERLDWSTFEWTPSELVPATVPAVNAAPEPPTRGRVAPAARPRTQARATVPPRPSGGPDKTWSDEQLVEHARQSAPLIPSVRSMKKTYGIGQARAERIRAELKEVAQ